MLVEKHSVPVGRREMERKGTLWKNARRKVKGRERYEKMQAEGKVNGRECNLEICKKGK